MLNQDPLWYKDAVFYELHVRAFYDGNDDGIGDFDLGHAELLGFRRAYSMKARDRKGVGYRPVARTLTRSGPRRWRAAGRDIGPRR